MMNGMATKKNNQGKRSLVSRRLSCTDNCIVKNYLMVINEYPYRNTHFYIS